MIARRTVVFGLFFATGGCTSLPASGPTASVIDPRQRRANQGYQVVNLDAEVASILERLSGFSLADGFGSHHPGAPSQQLGIGDTLSVTVFEAGPGGLFTPQTEGPFTAGGHQTVIPNQTIDRDGSITVPYAGTVRAAGRTPKAVAADIQKKLGPRALEPQVMVALANNAAATASVLGEVTSGGKVNLGIRGERILDVIAAAGGIKAPEHEVIVRLMRGPRTASVPLHTIISRPSENIYVQPDDTILLIRQRMTFTALGAVGRQGSLPIPSNDFTLSEALGAAGGLNDNRADQSGLFLFRFERPELVRALGNRIDPSVIGWDVLGKSPGNAQSLDYVFPIVYRIRLSDPASLLIISRVRVLDRDILYVANAPSVEIDKFLGIVGQTYGIIRGPISIAQAVG
ncbi:polysaccharide biosynthesis/export family protein [Mesorhizobium sp. VK4C]|uniref:polysaccharide biosynthesis/export family protein n=1 Tax=Mesorhizobium captivum TaxID=3072319 RepID=UPI002A241C83|nr:polysaccharide biosynthesis/export family protein [Mesorhizobium sp. VK4C]MDX8498945.1 polysaccharide biosynthesis/export family protein [Mesorhizobium sp. VK4C]